MNTNLPAIPKPGTAIEARQLLVLEQRIAASIGQIEDIELLEEWRRGGAALEAYLRGKELQRPMLGAQRRIEARIGQLLGEPKRGGKADEQLDSRVSETLSRPDDRADFRLLAKGFDIPLTDEEWRKSRRALVALLRQRLGLLPETPPLPEGQFRCIVADPPWQLDTGPNVFGGTGERGHDALEYTTMSVEEVAALPVQSIAPEDAHLYLWTTNRYVESAYGVARAWGFKPSVLLVWAKAPRGVGLGDAYRLTTEFMLYARRGTLQERRIIERTCFDWPRGRHSKKPDAFYEMVESVNHAPFLEMFARQKRKNWTAWGAEVKP